MVQISKRRRSSTSSWGRRSSGSSSSSNASYWLRRVGEAAWRNRSAIYAAGKDIWKGRTPTPKSRRRTPSFHTPSVASYSSRVTGRSTGRYTGKFAKRRKSPIVRPLTLHQKHGYSVVTETYGDVQDPHCLYLVHSTYAQWEIAKAILGALLRAVLNAADIQITSGEAVLPLSGDGDGDPNSQQHRFVIYFQNPLTNVVSSTIFTTNNPGDPTWSFETVMANFTSANNKILDILRGTDPSMIKSISLQETSATGPNYHVKAYIPVENMNLSIYTASDLTIQNRTSGAQASSGEFFQSDRIDNQPASGFIYTLKNGDPRYKRQQFDFDRPFNQVDEHGGMLAKASTMTPTYQEPPVPAVFSNLKTYSKVNLDPGIIKKTSLHHSMKGLFKTVMMKYRNRYHALTAPGPNGQNFVSGVIGASQVVALEEKIRSTSSNVLTVTYERQNTVAAMITVKKTHVPLATGFRSDNRSLTM